MDSNASVIESVARSAFRAAFSDPRFPELLPDEFTGLEIEISLLSPMVSVPVQTQEELEAVLRVAVDGLLLRHGNQSALFLPSVWRMLPEPHDFVCRLKQKAGWRRDDWFDDLQIDRFTVREISTTIAERT
jgi:AmmeMemoRadiSam system protein A